MFARSNNKLAVAGVALSVAAILTGACLLIDAYTLPGSWAASGLAMALRGLCVAGAMALFVWSCGRVESRRERQFEKLRSKAWPDPRAVAAARGPQLGSAFATSKSSLLPTPMQLRRNYPLCARGFVRAKDAKFPAEG